MGFKKVGSLQDAKRSLERNSDANAITWIKNSDTNVRFLEELSEAVEYWQHFDPSIKRAYVCTRDEIGECAYCSDGNRASRLFLINAVVEQEDGSLEHTALSLKKTIYDSLVGFWDKRGTIVDRWFCITKRGSGIDTVYNVVPDDPTPFEDGKGIDLKDTIEILQGEVRRALGGVTPSENRGDAKDVKFSGDETPPWDTNPEPAPKTTMRKGMRKIN